ncbi:hypothetical protein [Metabacillus niabensis]|uniref:hypothetical protein n=1 Tax=Metabacillus niabensis TaxID=324854 RepID=UPI0039A325F1
MNGSEKNILKNILKIIIFIQFPLYISIITMINVYILYALYHFGFGSVTVPEWHTGYDSKGFPEPFPVQKAIQYWNHKGQILALNCGIITFIGTYLFIINSENTPTSRSEVSRWEMNR